MPQQIVVNLCVNLNDENVNSEKFGLHEPNIFKMLSTENVLEFHIFVEEHVFKN